jgi:dipeptidase D
MKSPVVSPGKLFKNLICGMAVLSALGSVAAAGPDGGIEDAILSTFEQINRVPRCSKDEDRISAWLVGWASKRGFEVKQDEFKNVLVAVPATPGLERSPGVVLQSHMDMVCLKKEGSPHDFTKDGIALIRDGEWIRAKDTTLGADDGIGIAIALTLAERSTKPHPKLEILVTADEEKDMSGAAGLAGNLLSGTRFINLDSEDDSVLTLGSAGGLHTDISLPTPESPVAADAKLFTVKVSGLAGGHSGVDINKNRGNASVLLARLLREVAPLRLVTLSGGTADNVIATSAEATLALGDDVVPKLEKRVSAFLSEAKTEFPGEAGLAISVDPIANSGQLAASPENSSVALNLIALLPQGVTAWSKAAADLPETSNNVGIVRMADGGLQVATFQRSFHAENLEAISMEIASTAKKFGASAMQRGLFPSWPPNTESALAKLIGEKYQQLYGTPMVTEVIHAGLECGNIAAKYPAMEIVSIGPTTLDVHSTNERVKVASLLKIWNLLEEVLQAQ